MPTVVQNAEVALRDVARDAARCQRCPLYKLGTQTVFGSGPPDAPVMIVGEQPGDVEDREGLPFVGPAGRMLDRTLEIAGLRRDRIYVTNAVKHFKWEPAPNQKVRIHKTPNAREVRACRPWWEAEVELVEPEVVCCLGAVAAKALLGPDVRITRDRGRVLGVGDRLFSVVATVHPASVLRAGSGRDDAFAGLVADLRTVAECLTA